MKNTELDKILADLYSPQDFKDHCPNGMVVEGSAEISYGITGVSLNEALIDAAISKKAQFIIVHHPHDFWNQQPNTLRGIRKRKVAKLLAHEMNVWGFHLPMDAHPILGNNAVCARMIDLEIQGTWLKAGRDIAVWGSLRKPFAPSELQDILQQRIGTTLYLPGGDHTIQNLALCTGAAPNEIEQVAQIGGMDAFLTGEARETTAALAKELGIHFYACGHHNTEVFGPKALAEHLTQTTDLEVEFVNIPNPV